MKTQFAWVTWILVFCFHAAAQPANVVVESPPSGPFGALLRPYQKRNVPPINLSNSGRLESLVRAGNLYLSAQDVVALALENNIEIEIQRYGPLLSREVLRRAEAGGALRDISIPIFPGAQSASLAGVNVSGIGLATGAGINSGGGIVAQYGAAIPNLDPLFQAYANFGHNTTPESNIILFDTNFVVADTRTYQFSYSQAFMPGTNISLTYGSQRVSVNYPTSTLNPFTNGSLGLNITQNLLQGFGNSVNNRYIRIAKNNAKETGLQFKQQVITTVSAALNLYWDLVSFNEDVRLKEQALAAAGKLYEDNQKEAELGVLAGIEVTRAGAEVPARQEDLLLAQTNLLQQENLLKNALSKRGAEDPLLDEVHIVPLDRIQVPDKEDLPPVKEMIQEALAQRPDLAQTRIEIESRSINLAGSKSALRPAVQAFATLTNHGLAGQANPLNAGNEFGTPIPYYIGDYGSFLGQIFRRDFPDYSAGFSVSIPFRNRAAQADYATDQLQLRQSELQFQRIVNQVGVDVRNAVIGLQQAHARYETAVQSRKLAEQTLSAEETKFRLGNSTVFLVIQSQRDVVASQTDEVEAMANYTHARIAFEQALGLTLDMNHISMAEAASGQVQRRSAIPDILPRENN